jgi:rare lipoprotein A
MKKILIAILCSLSLSGCAALNYLHQYSELPISDNVGEIPTEYNKIYLANTVWYQNGIYTANGDIFSRDMLTAAHRTLPFGTILKLTNPHNNKSVNVVINDRGPFTKNLHLDVTRRVAEVLDFKSRGRVVLHVELLMLPTKEK